MIWDPVFSPDSERVLVKAQRQGNHLLVVDGRPGKSSYEYLWNPAISADGEKVLIRCIQDGKYYRKVIAINDI